VEPTAIGVRVSANLLKQRSRRREFNDAGTGTRRPTR
jgi:hypothetical protein